VFFGVGAMTMLYGGIRSAQFYVMAMAGYNIYQFIKSLADDDDEEEEIEQGYLNPETIERELLRYADEEGRELSMKDMDYYIRTVWIPETFAGGIQDVFGLSDEATAKLARVADMGLPALAGIDVSNSVALTSLWHPVEPRADTPTSRFFESIGLLLSGPSGALPTAGFRVQDEVSKGNIDRAIEAGMPAFLRGYVRSQRLQEEGLVVGKNRDIVLRDPSFYDTYTLMMQSLGFPEAETSRAMQLDIRAGEIEREIAEERTSLLDQRYRALNAIEANSTEETQRALREVERNIEIYNLNYPSNAITRETKQRSIQQKRREAAERTYGLGVDSNIPIRQPLMEERLREQMREQE
jgi:hypothetical protein